MTSRDWVNLTLGEMTWWERTQAAVSFLAACAVCLAGAFVFIVFVLGPTIDVADQRREEHDRCLKRATNGYEIKKCR